MDWLRFNSGNSGILESTREYSGMTQGSYRNDLGMTWEYLRDSGRVRDITVTELKVTTEHTTMLVRLMVQPVGSS